MTEKRFTIDEDGNITDTKTDRTLYVENRYTACNYYVNLLNELFDENEQLKKGMIEVVDRYIKNVECNPPSSLKTYGKIKGALINIREGLRDLIGDFE